MSNPGFGQPHKLRDFLDWLKAILTPALVVPLVLLAGFHLVWMLSGTPYDLRSLIVTGGTAAAAVLVIIAARLLGVGHSSGIKAFLLVTGLGIAVFAAMLYLGAAKLDLNSQIKNVGIVSLIVSILIIVAAANLHQDEEPVTSHPKFIEQRDIPLRGGSGQALVRTFRGFGGRGIDKILAAAEAQISTEDLHYVAYHVDGFCQFSIDVLDHPDIPADEKVSGDQRRSQYLRHGLKLNKLMVSLNQEFRSIDSGILLRVVLDVERGALYYFWVDDARFLIGVTMDQSQVHKADAKMVQLVDAVRPLLGHKRIEDLNR